MGRKFVFALLVLLVVVMALALYRHWLIFSVHSPQEGQVELSMTLDHAKFRDDFASFTGNNPAHSQTTAAAAEIRGKIVSVDNGRQAIQVQGDRGIMTVEVPLAAKIRIGDRDGTFADLQSGMTVSVSYQSRDGRNSAQTISAETL